MTASATPAPYGAAAAAGALVPERVWPSPVDPAPNRLVVGAAAAGAAAAAFAVAPRPGLGLTLATSAVLAVLLPLLRRQLDIAGWALLACVAALAFVPTRTDSEWLAALSVLTVVGLGALLVTRATGWAGIVLSGPVAAVSMVRSLPWAGRRVAGSGLPDGSGRLARGVILGALPALLVAALFASADPAFDRLVRLAAPRLDLDDLPLRGLAFLIAAVLVLGGALLLTVPVRWAAVERPALRGPWSDWVPALLLVDLVTLAFIVLQGVALFGGHAVVTAGTGVTYAERAREGFGQLVVTTAVTLAVLAWAGARSRPEHRRALVLLGGGLVVFALLVVASALNRLWLYSEAYGLTVTRVLAVVVEAWLALVLVLVAVAGARRRGSWVPRATVLSGAALFTALALTGPDAVVAASHVERFERTGAVDVSYLSQLSADAAPALARLPEPYRSCVLARPSAGGPAPGDATADDLPWTSWNLARRLAADPAHQPVIMSPSGCRDTSTSS